MPQDYKVKAGDCVNSVAYTHGFFWKTIWNHPNNSDLKSRREDPNILLDGDVIHIPDLRQKQESGAVDSHHRFKVKGVPAKLRLQFLGAPDFKRSEKPAPKQPALAADDGGLFGKVVGAVKDVLGMASGSTSQSVFEDPDPEPLTVAQKEPKKNVNYILNIDGNLTTGKTDSSGIVELSIPPDAKAGSITLSPGTPDEVAYPLKLGHLDPISDANGVMQRLAHLGYRIEGDGSQKDKLAVAVKAFQKHNGLQVTGELDGQTRNKIKERHGS